MRKLLGFSLSILALSLAFAVVMHQFSEIAIASSVIPVATEVTTASGMTGFLSHGQSTNIPLPTYADGSLPTSDECGAIVSQRVLASNVSMNFVYDLSGSALVLTGFTVGSNAFYYMIVCTRSALGTVAVEETTWGQVKELYSD